jgi:pimeloyl-ACP methyl ester carboxylesterase
VLAEQARAIDRAAPFCSHQPSATDIEQQLPLTQTQQELLAATELDASGCAYLVHVALHIQGEPDRAALRQAFATLAARHPALRMTVASPAHGRVHEHLPDGWWREHDMLAQAPSDLSWPRGLLDEINRPMPLASAGVMRVDLWPVAGRSCLLVWTVHHVSIDEATIDRCLAELNQILAGAELAPVYGSPLGFASLEKAWTDHDAVDEWSDRLLEAWSGTGPPLPRAPGPGRETPLRLPVELGRRLGTASAAWGITPFAPLLTAFGLALQDVFGAARRFVSTPFSRRMEPELIEPAGCLVDLRILEAGARRGEALAETLARVHQATLAHQRTSFLPRRALAEAIGQRNPSVLEQLNSFAFTWRLDPTRPLEFGPHRARLLRVPQTGSRYGLVLHAAMIEGELHCSIEALEEAFVAGTVEVFAEAFSRRLEALCALPRLAPPGKAEPKRPPQVLAPGLRDVLAAAWCTWVGSPAEGISPSTNFLQCGGNSLTAMRMSAQLRRQHRLEIDPGAFLARPTFDNLCALAAAQGPFDSVLVGNADAPRVVLLIPGKGGQALGLYRLAEHLQRRLGSDHAVIVLDLDVMLRRSPGQEPLRFLRERMAQAVTEVGQQRITAIVGFSLGGLLALQLAQGFPRASTPVVWLLDAYAPRTMRRTLSVRIERRIGRAFSASKRAALFPHSNGSDASPGTTEPAPEGEQIGPLWDTVQRELSTQPAAARNAEVHLVQAVHSASELGLLWRRGSNGFNPHHYADWKVHRVDAAHLDLPRSMALAIAELIIANLRRSYENTERG